jgi:cytochrome c-type biogenesis protein
MTWIKKYSARLVKVGGYVMVLMGVLLYFDAMTGITIFFVDVFGGFKGF